MKTEKRNHDKSPKFDEIGYWSEVKLDIVKKYAQAYTSILSKKSFKFSYIDGFAGAGVHLAKESNEFIPGSPLNALKIVPPFNEYFLVDLDGDKVEHLQGFPEVEHRRDVHVIHGDCNEVLLKEVFPKVRYEDYRRALCILDPYGLHLKWKVIETAGKMGSIEIFLNFPIMDMNRNALWRKPELARPEQRARMTAFWGNESWKKVAFPISQTTLFGENEEIKAGNKAIVGAYTNRLKSVAEFKYVPEPIPMRSLSNTEIYYLFFASQQPVAAKIVQDIFNSYKDRRA